MANLGEDQLEGLVLCKAGEFRFASSAVAVSKVRQLEPGEDLPRAVVAWGEAIPFGSGRVLEEDGQGLVIDSLEVVPDRVAMLPVPAILLGAVGGALRGFVQVGGALWPLLSVRALARHVMGVA